MRISLLSVVVSFLAACGGSTAASPSEPAPTTSGGEATEPAAEARTADEPATDAQAADALAAGWPDTNTCLPQVVSDARERGGICLQPEVIGDERVEACRAALQADGWVRDDAAEERTLNGTGVRIVCVHAP